jgi:hypothetical protein
VDAVDISDVALESLGSRAQREGLAVRCLPFDFEPADGPVPPLPVSGPYGLVLMIRYTNTGLLPRLTSLLAPGGYLVVELHLESDGDVVGPRDPRFRVAAGELRELAGDLEILAYGEGIVVDPDGRRAALARLVARRPGHGV